MSQALNYWAFINTVIIMLGLGMAPVIEAQHRVFSAPVLRGVIVYNVLAPACLLLVVKVCGGFPADNLVAMSLCVACAGGTSAGAFMSPVGGLSGLAGKLIVGSVVASLFTITIFSRLNWVDLGTLSLPWLGAYLLSITLIPFLAGKALQRTWPAISGRWQPIVDRLAGLLVILLIVVLLLRYAKPILTGPREPLLAGVVLVLMFTIPPFFERTSAQRRTMVLVSLIRNLTLVLAVLAVLPNAEDLLPTVLAFGLFMYIAAGLLIGWWYWKPVPSNASPAT